MSLQAFEQLVNDKGLVRMVITTDNYAPYSLGQIAGFQPEEALRLFQIEAAQPSDENGRPLPLAVAAVVPVATAPAGISAVAIPDDWESQHHLRRIHLAKEIRGTQEPVTATEADEIIRAQLRLREGA